MQSPWRDASQFGELLYCEHGININHDVTLMSRMKMIWFIGDG
jgi:hypothetical protein